MKEFLKCYGIIILYLFMAFDVAEACYYAMMSL